MSDDIRRTENWWPGVSCSCISDASNEDWIAIPRAQHEALISDQAELVSLKLYIEELERKHEALMAAAEAIARVRKMNQGGDNAAALIDVTCGDALIGLRAAGIEG